MTVNNPETHLMRSMLPVLAERAVEQLFAHKPELQSRYGHLSRAKYVENACSHLSYLIEAMDAGQKELFGDYIRWEKIMLAKRGIAMSDLVDQLEKLAEVLASAVPGQGGRMAVDYIESSVANLPSVRDDVPSSIAGDGPLDQLAREYLEMLLRGERHLASSKILLAAHNGTPVKDIYLQVFQRSQYELGRLWRLNEISVAQEHYCTATTQLIMSQLYPFIFSGEKKHGNFVAAGVAGELHELGARMIADFFEMDGWNTFYLGTNTPSEDVVKSIGQRDASLLGISATMTYHITTSPP